MISLRPPYAPTGSPPPITLPSCASLQNQAKLTSTNGDTDHYLSRSLTPGSVYTNAAAIVYMTIKGHCNSMLSHQHSAGGGVTSQKKIQYDLSALHANITDSCMLRRQTDCHPCETHSCEVESITINMAFSHKTPVLWCRECAPNMPSQGVDLEERYALL